MWYFLLTPFILLSCAIWILNNGSWLLYYHWDAIIYENCYLPCHVILQPCLNQHFYCMILLCMVLRNIIDKFHLLRNTPQLMPNSIDRKDLLNSSLVLQQYSILISISGVGLSCLYHYVLFVIQLGSFQLFSNIIS